MNDRVWQEREAVPERFGNKGKGENFGRAGGETSPLSTRSLTGGFKGSEFLGKKG